LLGSAPAREFSFWPGVIAGALPRRRLGRCRCEILAGQGQLPCRSMSTSQSTAKRFRPSRVGGSAAAGRGWRRDLLERGFRRTTSSNASPHTGKRCATRQCPLTYNPAIRYAQRSNPGRGFREVQRRAGDTGQPSEARPLCVGGRPVRHSIARYRVGKIRYRPGAGNHRRQETRAPPHS